MTAPIKETNLESDKEQFITVRLNKQLFGINVDQVQDILKDQKINPIPLAPNYVKGSINLRGKIVTAIDVKKKINAIPPANDIAVQEKAINIVIEHKEELYSLLVDEVNEVLRLSKNKKEKNPSTLDKSWQKISQGIYQLKKELLVILDIHKLLNEET